MFHHPSTACNEQNLNSIIVKPGHGEAIPLFDVNKIRTYRIAGIAYDGSSHEVQRVEVSLDGGETWLYCGSQGEPTHSSVQVLRQFMIDDKQHHFRNVSLILGGSGITPGYQLISRIIRANDQGVEEGKTNLKVINAKKTEDDILLRDELDRFAEDHPEQFKIAHVLSHPGDSWRGENGHVSKDILQKYAFGPEKGNLVLLCGPPAMIQEAVLPALREIGYKEDGNLFGF